MFAEPLFLGMQRLHQKSLPASAGYNPNSVIVLLKQEALAHGCCAV
jgi:hypothetical protein